MDTIGQRLKHERNRRALSQDELSDSAGVTKATISRIENDKLGRDPNRATIRKLAEALLIDPGWLLTGESPTVHDGTYDA